MKMVILLDSSGNNPLLVERRTKNSLRKEHLIINKPHKMKNTDTKQKIKVKIHRTSDYDDKYTGIRDFPHEKAMLQYGLCKVDKVIIQKYTKDDEFVIAARKTRGIQFDYDMEMCD
jgi:hypothetical protein